ncbi:hypothetical protein QE152_g9253 [Popillia japonica]|uniref:Endonuclease/exonuclease/phosphatase domain-containing protein n=1 Tax=Popillia japonica TaxID=7064 RepID=A0AAW1LZ14_POPJA
MSKTVHNLEQRERLQNLEIQGLPQVENENFFAVLKDIGDVIKCSINEEDIEVVPPGDDAAYQFFVANLSSVTDRADTDIFLILGDFNRPNITWICKGNTLEPLSYDNKSIDFIDTLSYCNSMQFNSISNSDGRLLDLANNYIIESLTLSDGRLLDLANNYIIESLTLCNSPLIQIDNYHPALDITIINCNARCLRYNNAPTRLFRKGNYTLINEELASLRWLEDLNSIDDIDKAVDYFYSVLSKIINKHVPLRVNLGNRFPHWFSLSTVKAIKKAKYHKRWKLYRNKLFNI